MKSYTSSFSYAGPSVASKPVPGSSSESFSCCGRPIRRQSKSSWLFNHFTRLVGNDSLKSVRTVRIRVSKKICNHSYSERASSIALGGYLLKKHSLSVSGSGASGRVEHYHIVCRMDTGSVDVSLLQTTGKQLLLRISSIGLLTTNRRFVFGRT